MFKLKGFFLFVVFFLVSCISFGLTVNTSGEIVDLHSMEFVSVFDTPPDITVLTIRDSSIRDLTVYDSSIVNLENTSLNEGLRTNGSSTVNVVPSPT